MIELRDLHYFRLVADLGHVGKAAEQAHRTQPAITKSIQRIERELGAELFDRSQRRMTLSPLGEMLRERGEALLRDVEHLRRELKGAARGEIGHVRLGVSTTAAHFLLTRLSDELLRTHPGITLEVEVGMNDHLAAALAGRKLDIVMAPATELDPDLHFEPTLVDHVVVVAARGHPLLARRRLELADLQPYRWVLPSRSTQSRRWLNQAFLERGLPAPVAHIESNAISLTPWLFANSQLLSFVSRLNLVTMKALAVSVREVKLPQLVLPREFGILTRAGAHHSPAVEVVRRLAVSVGQALSGD